MTRNRRGVLAPRADAGTPGPKKKRARGSVPVAASASPPRPVRGGAKRGLAYPTAREWIAAAAIAAAGLAGSGCAEPVCDTSRIGELRTHGEIAIRRLIDLELSPGLEHLGIATGITPHPWVPLPGAMMMPVPILPGPEESAETGEKD